VEVVCVLFWVVPTGERCDAMATVCVKMKGKLRAMSTKMVET